VHRDIKPANIFLCRYGEDHDFVKVLDFGIVKAQQAAEERGTALTGENVIRGTPAFMAPEQALGEEAVDGRADVYAVGCVAYWLLTGKPVFSADTPTGLLLKHIREAPVPPSARTELPVPAALEEIVLACLEKDPAKRPQTARELSTRLGEVDGAAEWSEGRCREWWAKHRPAATPAG
jgi:serine/threonine-protein kinase